MAGVGIQFALYRRRHYHPILIRRFSTSRKKGSSESLRGRGGLASFPEEWDMRFHALD